MFTSPLFLISFTPIIPRAKKYFRDVAHAGKIIIIHDFRSVDHNLLASLCGVPEGIFNGDELIAG